MPQTTVRQTLVSSIQNVVKTAQQNPQINVLTLKFREADVTIPMLWADIYLDLCQIFPKRVFYGRYNERDSYIRIALG